MTRLLPALLLACAALPAQAATCLVHVGGTTHYDGPCQFLPFGGDGSFEMMLADGRILAEVNLFEPGLADAWWYEGNGAATTGTPLGTLHRDNRDPACWLNGAATLCAW